MFKRKKKKQTEEYEPVHVSITLGKYLQDHYFKCDYKTYYCEDVLGCLFLSVDRKGVSEDKRNDKELNAIRKYLKQLEIDDVVRATNCYIGGEIFILINIYASDVIENPRSFDKLITFLRLENYF